MRIRLLFIPIVLIPVLWPGRAGAQDTIPGEQGLREKRDTAVYYEQMASAWGKKSDWENTLRYYLKALAAFSKQESRNDEARILNAIARGYSGREVYKKSALYHELEFSMYGETNNAERASAAEKAGDSYYRLGLDSLAASWYLKARDYYGKNEDSEGMLRCRNRLGILYTNLGDYNKASAEYESTLVHFTDINDRKSIASTCNQIGFILFRKKDVSGALESFNKAIQNSGSDGNSDHLLTDAWSNRAVCMQNLGNEAEMLSSFNKALGYAESSGRLYEAARIQRIIASYHFRKGDMHQAEVYCLECIGSAKASGSVEQLYLCYRDYSDVLENGNDFINALDYYEKYLNLRDSLNFENRIAEKQKEDKIASYEALEQRLKDEIASEEIRDLELKNLRAETVRREMEINLLLTRQELDRSEIDRLNTSLALEREQSELNRREQDILALRQQQEYDSLALRQKDLDAERLTTLNQLLETQKNQETERAQKARQIRNMAVILGALMVLVAVMILFGLISTRKQNQRLAESKRQIEKINADLAATNEEVLKQKEIIEQKNQSITDSIQYARRIQTAVLPPENFMDEWGLENFILFRPKDIVSGDFYWGVRKGSMTIIAAADCTGHGVPGAFMSMLGHAFLEEIVNTREIRDAAGILNILRDEIINTLRQKGSAGEARDGMDISLVMLDINRGSLDYAGANNPLYLVRDGKLLKYMPDRMPIGIHFISYTPFTNKVVELRKGDCLYLFSDGYADQFGGPKGRKYMYKPFQELLLKNSSKPMTEQKEILDSEFMEWMEGYEQVDDVLVLGIRI
ncbi:MAG: SpoIIE family protein phosphatase [Bacteroidales bacterium]|nr:SpoIIE family protein phosphatase [Bacteroidales bacterium]